jgi:hypothetical protein
VRNLELSSGAVIPEPQRLLGAFFEEEWAYYDGIDETDPARIEPLDVVATLSVNSFLSSATRIRSVHRGLVVACERDLDQIPVDADLRTFPIDQIVELLDAACQVPYVLVPVATKVLHRKRRKLIPMLDSVVTEYYLDAADRTELLPATQNKHRAASVARVVLEGFKADLESAWSDLEALQSGLDQDGFPVSRVRILEVLVWIANDPRRQYLSTLDTT